MHRILPLAVMVLVVFGCTATDTTSPALVHTSRVLFSTTDAGDTLPTLVVDTTNTEAPVIAVGSSTERPTALIECGEIVSLNGAKFDVTPAGGTIRVGTTKVTFPKGAVTLKTRFEVIRPVGTVYKANIHAKGFSEYRFQKPITITFDYSSCSTPGMMGVWYVNESNALLEYMGGVTDTLAKTITFSTPHLSGYAIASFKDEGDTTNTTGTTGN